MLGLAAIAVVLVVAVLAPILFGHPAGVLDVTRANQTSSAAHVAGTDRLGRDILLRVLSATRLSIGLALAATALGAAIGVPLGSAAAVVGRRPRVVILRAIDALLAFPAIIVAIFVGAIMGPGALGATVGVGIAISFSFARVASTLALSVGGREYVVAARVLGVSRIRRFLRYVLPNIAETMVITTSVQIGNSIVFISSLSFLGLGVQPPLYDWGSMLTQGVQAFYLTPAAALAPAAAIALSALAVGFAGEALARAMNPLLWERGDRAHAERTPSEAPIELLPGFGAASAAPAANGGNGHGAVSTAPVLQVDDLVVSYPSGAGAVEVVSGVSFTVARGETVGIVGESGSGKTMTAMAIAQLTPHPGEVSGTVRLDGQDLAELRPGSLDEYLGTDLAVVFQDPMSSLNPALKVGRQLTESAEVHRDLSRAAATEEAVARLYEVNMPTPERQLERYPHELSGGMRQRAMIAMGLMNEPSLLIADEPTTALDVTIQAQIMDLFAKVNQTHGTAVILISHNLALVKQTCHRVLVMYAGEIVEEIPSDRLLVDPLHPYTQALIAVVPDLVRPRDQPLASIAGSAPDLADLPAGCPFHPRCPLAVDKCRTRRPPLAPHGSGRRVACWVANEDVT
jgi:peptide/nickel transport system permease protein